MTALQLENMSHRASTICGSNCLQIMQSYSRNDRLTNPYHPEPASSPTSTTTGFYGTGFYRAVFRDTAFYCVS